MPHSLTATAGWGWGRGNCCLRLLKEFSAVRMMDVGLPGRNASELNLRVVSRSEERVEQFLVHLGLELPTSPKVISDVISKVGGQNPDVRGRG